jgi:excinuclease ABC subunit A
MKDAITVKGARVHNLKNIDVTIPKNKLVVITGMSGSGKSSLAFDTIYAEGQRKYVESLSAYARQFLGLMEKPDVDYIDGLSPAISIDQKSAGHNPRSTVGTITEIYDYLRLLYARIGHPHCPNCGREVVSQSIEEIANQIVDKKGVKGMILSPVIRNRKGEYEDLLQGFYVRGFARVRIDGKIHSLEDEIKLERYKAHSIDVVVDRLVIPEESSIEDKQELFKRVSDSVETAVNLSDGEVIFTDLDTLKDTFFSEHLACIYCKISIPEIEPHTFSFNSPFGACSMCKGLGILYEIDPDLVFNPDLTILEGGIFPWSRNNNPHSWTMTQLATLAELYGFSLKEPLKKISPENIQRILYGVPEDLVINYTTKEGITKRYTTMYSGVIPSLKKKYDESDSEMIRRDIEKYMRDKLCPQCNGKKLNEIALHVLVTDKSIIDVTATSIKDALVFFDSLPGKLTENEKTIAKQIVKEILSRLTFLDEVGLNYLTLDRSARTLSGGESQRIRLASQIGTGLSGVLYVLDEPSIGLHQKDNERLLHTLQTLKELGNSVIVVEHDEDTIKASDYVVDIGPKAGELGGEIIATGNWQDLAKNEKSITGKYLNGYNKNIMSNNRKGNGNIIKIMGAKEHNLKNITITLPLGTFTAVTGVSGSGKSTLVNQILYNSLSNELMGSHKDEGAYRKIEGYDNLDKVILIDQSPIGRTPRSNPATYTGVFTDIRSLFANVQDAKVRGYLPGRFSFNVKGGRCENCKGDGVMKIEMQFLPDVYVTCDVCNGKRYNREALSVLYKGKSIYEVLEMTVDEGLEFFKNISSIKNKLETLKDVGLGYIRLGQSALTLSGGEAQRVKLSTELSRRATGKTLYILDEPTTGLHFADVDNLLYVLQKLVDQGNTVLVIEHNLDVIRSADWIIDLGPDGGDNGGQLLVEGNMKKVANTPESYTGQFLQKYL